MSGDLEFYFDFLSPFACLAHERVCGLAGAYGRKLTYRRRCPNMWRRIGKPWKKVFSVFLPSLLTIRCGGAMIVWILSRNTWPKLTAQVSLLTGLAAGDNPGLQEPAQFRNELFKPVMVRPVAGIFV